MCSCCCRALATPLPPPPAACSPRPAAACLPQSFDVQSDELVRDLWCVAAMKLQGGLASYVLKRAGDDRHPQVVRSLVERMTQEQEAGWLDAIIQELINYGAWDCRLGGEGRGGELQSSSTTYGAWGARAAPSGRSGGPLVGEGVGGEGGVAKTDEGWGRRGGEGQAAERAAALSPPSSSQPCGSMQARRPQRIRRGSSPAWWPSPPHAPRPAPSHSPTGLGAQPRACVRLSSLGCLCARLRPRPVAAPQPTRWHTTPRLWTC